MDEATTFDFGAGPVPAHRHTNPDESVGGWVDDTAWVEAGAVVGAGARIGAVAWVGADAVVGAGAQVGAGAVIGAGAVVEAGAWVGGGAWVGAGAWVGVDVVVGAGAWVEAGAQVGAGAVIATALDCAVVAWGGYAGTAYPITGDVMIRYGCECHPLAEWTDAAILAMCQRHVPGRVDEYAAALRAWVALVRVVIRPAPACAERGVALSDGEY